MSKMSITGKWHSEWLEYVLHEKNTPDDWKDIVSNDNFLPEFMHIIEKYLQTSYTRKLIWSAFGTNSNVTIRFILNNPQYMQKWDWKTISCNKNMTPSVIDAHPYLPWNFEAMSGNPSVFSSSDFLSRYHSRFDVSDVIPNAPLDFIEKNIIVFSYFYQDRFWNLLSSNPNITGENLLSHLDKTWKWESLTSNPGISIDFIEDHLDLPWDWKILSRHKMTVAFYERHIIHSFFDISDISMNPNMIPFFLSHSDWHWDWKKISRNKGLTFSLVTSLPDKDWDWFELSRHPNITMQDIFSSTYPWSFYSMSWNPNLSIAFLKKTFFQPWSRKYFLKNNTTLGRERYIDTEYGKMVTESKRAYETEIMERAWSPDRLEWVMDEDQKERWGVRK
jgi:hypothetical protein